TLSGMTLFNGKVASGNGGAVRIADENVTLSQMTLIGNSAPAGSGGAIAVESSLGKLQLDDCVFSGNSAGQNGGAISTAHTTLNLYRTHLANNTAGSDGGGIFMPSGGTLSVTSSAITGNLANTPGSNSNHGGGGIFFYGQLGTSLDIHNSTISSNRATSGQGGGVMILGFNQTATVRNSTITANTAGPASRGGGIMCFLGAGLVQLDSSIVAGNVNGLAPDIYSGGTVTANFSAVGSKTGIGTFTADATTSGLLGADLKLGPLADNGGPTPTHLPAIDSPVVNKGSNPASAPADQRGAGYGRARTGTPDIGAVEAPTAFVVTNANNSGAGSLRQAVLDANDFVGADTINFDPVAFVSPQTITLTGTGLGISEAVAIVGPGPTRATISGGNAVQIINATATLDNTVVSISGLTFTQGKSAAGGGAIAAQGQSLVLDNCVFTNNFATSGGGAILTGLGNSYDGGLTANDCVFINNSTVQRGGAIFAPGGSLLALNRCTLSGNQATSGGAIYGFTNFTLDYSTVSGNQASGIAGGGIGGGIYISLNYFSPLGAIRNSTISGNKAQTDGGGLHMGVSPGMMLVQNSTIVNNTANTKGGGIIRNSGPTLNVVSSIVSNNQGTNGPDIYDPFAGSVSVTFSAIGNAQGFTLNGNNNLPFGTNLLLGPLANNGGPTQTHRPLVGSPLIDSSSNIVVFGTDQRGVSRSLGKGTDIGAVETAYELVVTNSLGDGLGSLRQCVSDANNDAGINTITFDPLAFATPQSIRSNGGEIAITESVAIYGPGSSMATIDAKGANRVFRVDAPGSGNVVIIAGLTITGGSMPGGSGGGIYLVDESLTLTDCVISGNTASSSGGGIATGTATLTLNNCTVANNVTGSHGGGLSVDGTAAVVVQNSTFFGNSSYFAGGGIDIYNGGSLLLSGSTISGNSSNSVGGGVYFGGTPSGGGFVVRNSTFSGNSAGSSGGGIAIQSFSGSTTVQNSTFTANSTLAGKGGGIAVLVASHALAIESSILSGNTTNVGGPDISSPGTVTVTTSLLGSLAGITTFVPDAISTLSLGKNPLLGPLANNGGPTKTHALLPGSPAINNGSNPTLQSNDQRGAGFVRVSAGSPDMGAFEVQPAAKIASVVINNGDAQRSRVTKITVNFDQLVTFADSPVAAFKLKRQSDNAYVGLTAAVNNGATTSVDLTFNDAGAEFGSLTDGRYTLSVLAAPAGNFDGNGDGTAGDDYTLVGDPATNKLFRLFGDADGSGQVNASDFLAFRLAFLSSSSTFDFNGNGQVDAGDLLQFRLRFLQTV
ncbi:MAG: right-handed parallel beta-helix repeat-containing protein, partial [Gemmataceae bacterium]|nr:right-handed parallel beta-helix repeat-containing protein [Gemmataceae bacterium]